MEAGPLYQTALIIDTSITSSSLVDILQCQIVRREVFQKEQGIARELDFDDKDFAGGTFHILIYNHTEGKKTPVATVRGRRIDYPKGVKLERMCVLPAHRRQKLGQKLLDVFEFHASALGFREIWLHAQVGASKFYLARGFRFVGGPFLEAGIEHYLMAKSLFLQDEAV